MNPRTLCTNAVLSLFRTCRTHTTLHLRLAAASRCPTPAIPQYRWELVPGFTRPGEKPDHWKMFNARAETVAEKSAFSRLLRRLRCVVPVDGFYE